MPGWEPFPWEIQSCSWVWFSSDLGKILSQNDRKIFWENHIYIGCQGPHGIHLPGCASPFRANSDLTGSDMLYLLFQQTNRHGGQGGVDCRRGGHARLYTLCTAAYESSWAQTISLLGNKKPSQPVLGKGISLPAPDLVYTPSFCITTCTNGPQLSVFQTPPEWCGVLLLWHEMGWLQSHCPHGSCHTEEGWMWYTLSSVAVTKDWTMWAWCPCCLTLHHALVSSLRATYLPFNFDHTA